MAFRIGHQITCNLKKIPIFRSLSVDSSHENKSQSCTAVNRRLNTNASTVIKGRKLHVSRTRSLPPPENSFLSPNRWFSSKFPDSKPDDPQYVTEYKEQRPSTSGRSSATSEQYEEVVLEDKASLQELQPSNAKPVTDNCIRNEITFLTKSTRDRLDKIDELKKSAHVQYEKAVKAFVGHEEDDCCRYQLEAARRKVDQSNEFYHKFKKQYESEVEKAHQLQPKNIKPYGKLNTLPWTGPNSEYRKLSIVDQDRKRSRYETIFEKRRRMAADEIKSPADLGGQQREYCTTNTNSHVSTSPALEKCKAIIAEYKKLNPDYTGKTNKVIPGSDEEKLLIEKTQELISRIKSADQNKETGKLVETSDKDNSNVVSSTITKKTERENLHGSLHSAITNQPKLVTSQPINQKVVLYYQNKYKNKTLCSKIVQSDMSPVSPTQELSNNTVTEVKVEVGPKLMLQSFDLNDRTYNAQDLIPAPNVKFVAPWLSWSDRVKQHIQKKLEYTDSIRSNSVSETTLQKDSTSIGMEIQKRQFSQTSNSGCFTNTFTLPEPQVFNDNTSIFLKNVENIPSFSASLGRLYSTNSTRGVLGPEGTVMVKLRRLPKISIPEPIKDCSAYLPPPCEKSDGVIEIKQKKLPKLPSSKYAVRSMRNAAFAPMHLERPKSRGVPPEPPRECPRISAECMEPRADDGMVINQKKLPKIEVHNCRSVQEHTMTSPPLPRLKPRPLPPSKRSADIREAICLPRADAGLRVMKKKLPDLRMSDCCPDSPTTMTVGEPLKRLKKLHIPEPEKVCLNIATLCPPRADEVFGYKVKRKKLQTLILGERYNNLSWKEFNAAKDNRQARNYTTDSKYSMCCYSDKSVHPNFTTENNVDNAWDKFNGQLFCEENGKLSTYLPPEEKIDDSMGSELKIVKKPIGTLYTKDDRIHEELLKGGFTTFINQSDRKFSSYKESCGPEPDPPQYTDWRVKPLKKRPDFHKDFPSRTRFHTNDTLCEYRGPCEGQERMDEILQYEVKPKKLPVIPKGKCKKVKRLTYKPIPRLPSRPKKKYLDSSYDCPKEECVDHCPPRADEGLIETYNKLIPLNKMSNIPQPTRTRLNDGDHIKMKRLPPPPKDDRPPCVVCDFCEERELQLKEEEEMELRRRAHGVDPNPKVLPRLAVNDCPRKPPPKMKSVRMRRLPKAPFIDRVNAVKETCDCNYDTDRADGISSYQKKPKKLKSILKANNKAFSTLPTNFLYNKNFSQTSFRCISTTALLLQTSDAKCKKIGKTVEKKCPKLTSPNSKCKATSISCNRKQKRSGPCTKQRSPYPSFSEYKEHHRPETITECMESERHLQPRWPILGEIINQKPPPPHQGKIDPTKQEECIARRFNMQMEGSTRTCETMGKDDKPLLTNEMYKEIINNPPFDKCECANEKTEKSRTKEDPKAPCPRVEHPTCPDPEIECELPQARPESKACGGESKSPKVKSSEKPKLICKKKEKEKKVDEEKDQEKENVVDECDELEKKLAISEKRTKARCKDKMPEEKMEKPQQSHDQPKECKSKEDGSLARKQQCDNKTKKKKEDGEKKCQQPAARSAAEKEKKGMKKGKKEKKSHCRNIKVCGKGKGMKSCKKDSKKSSKKAGKKGKPKKCSDLLKEEDAKEAKKKSKTKRSAVKTPQMADLCKQKKPCTPKPLPKPTSHSAVLLAKCPPKRSFWQKILDFFRARPNCPPPDQWKKDKLRKRAEKAAAAAGLELCEKKKPKEVKITCKKTGVRDSKLDKRTKTRGSKDKCKKIKVSCGTEKKTAKKRTGKKSKERKGTEGGECKDIKPECKKSSTKSAAKKKCKKVKSQAKARSTDDGAKVAEVVKAKECDPEVEKNCVDEKEISRAGKDEEKQPASTGKCKVLPKQKFCKPRARTSCKKPMINKECTPVESPYPSFSEVKKYFPRLPSSECTEQEKNIKRKSIKYDYNEPDKQSRKYSTTIQQKRLYSSNSNGDKKFDPLALLNMPEESLNEIEDNELALKILEIVKEGMKTTAIQNSNITKQKYYDIFKELEFLCEQELSRSISDDSIFGLNSTKSKMSNLLPDTNLSYSKSLASQKKITNMEETMMKDAIRSFCQTIFSMPNLSTMEYEDTEKAKTEKLQKQLDEILDNYKTK